jgi:hypothetical protein
VGLTSFERSLHYVEDAGHLVVSELSEAPDAVKINGDCGFIVNPMMVTIATQ